jgi:hypothetical protein
MSRRNRSNRRRTYGKRQHEVRERRPADALGDGSRDDAWVSPEAIDDSRRRDDAFSGDGFEGWAR